MRFVLSCAAVAALCLTGCGEMGWGAVAVREGVAEQAPPASRGKEVIELCGELKAASSPLCNDVDTLKKAAAKKAKH